MVTQPYSPRMLILQCEIRIGLPQIGPNRTVLGSSGVFALSSPPILIYAREPNLRAYRKARNSPWCTRRCAPWCTLECMGISIQLPSFECQKCGHSWTPRKPEVPERCGRCKSPYWDRAPAGRPGLRTVQRATGAQEHVTPEQPDDRTLIPFED